MGKHKNSTVILSMSDNYTIVEFLILLVNLYIIISRVNKESKMKGIVYFTTVDKPWISFDFNFGFIFILCLYVEMVIMISLYNLQNSEFLYLLARVCSVRIYASLA